VICQLSFPLLSLHEVNTVRHSYDTSAVFTQVYWLRTDIIRTWPSFTSRSSLLPMPNFLYKFLGRQKFQSSAQTLFDVRFRLNFHKIPTSFPFDILTLISTVLHAFHTLSEYLDLFYAHCNHQNTVRSVACRKLEVSGKQV